MRVACSAPSDGRALSVLRDRRRRGVGADLAVIVPWGVFTRYVLNSAASWPEPMAILLSIVLTFFGAAACYRVGLHMRVSVRARPLPPAVRRIVDLSRRLMALVGLFMMIWGGTTLSPRPGTSRSPNFPLCRSASPICRSRSAAP